ncbi:MAG: NADP-dependent oxidoreductase, partial [Saccharospirillaceae bacterium]|nr:NADP-dependent oxidoreductase [Saccharospirillaceae bacterium]
MQAIVINQYGNATSLQPAELEKPTPAAGQVLIRVAAAGLNPVDFHIRNGMLAGTDTHQLPLVLGWDASGVIETLGAGVQHWQVGDAVMVHTPISLQGTYREYIVADASLLAAKPASLNLLQAAALPLAGLTAWQGIMVDGQLQAGQRVLIHNASGGVGSFAVQLAKAAG